ncbi:DUF6933 domain-containing protein [Cohnella cholangitidis]|uniref:DUF6933 domain-containing protein n=1 Tax=Cohnella cholangitidis TaxID=2598458 RepID=A0A7G5BSX8_9BACL|nr:hypothetical protein [Cohnella cholangitidis]QMV40062.1 hypothetical protein FPL14_01750 [Cohnella cholangitidis]
MASIACTKKLIDLAGFPMSPLSEFGYRPLHSWHANIFKIGRKNCLIIMNDLTRYQLVLYGIKKEHFKDFGATLRSNFEIILKADKFDEREIAVVISEMEKLTYTKTHNKSILGSVNDQILMTEHWIQKYLPTDDLNIVDLNIELNDSVILKLEEGYSRLAMKNALKVN